MSSSEPAVLIMARAPRRDQVRPALEPLLGSAGCAMLQSALLLEAIRWARGLEPRAIHVAHTPPDAGPELRRLLGAEIGLFPQNGEGISGRLADGAARVFARGPGPLLIVWPDVPRLRPEHGQAALGDLASGCDVVLGPVFDGGFYLVGIPRAMPALFALPELTWRSSDAMAVCLAAAGQHGLEVGILRAERALHRPADVRAALADPMLPDELARVLRGRVRAAAGAVSG